MTIDEMFVWLGSKNASEADDPYMYAIMDAIKAGQELATYCEDRFCWKSGDDEYEYRSDAVYLENYKAAIKETK